jgi:hypothetical protein
MATTDEHIGLPLQTSALTRPRDRHMLMLVMRGRRLSCEGHPIPCRDQASAELIILVRERESGVEPFYLSEDARLQRQVSREHIRIGESVAVPLHGNKLIVPPTLLQHTKTIRPVLQDRPVWTDDQMVVALLMHGDMRLDERWRWLDIVVEEQEELPHGRCRSVISGIGRTLARRWERKTPECKWGDVVTEHALRSVAAGIHHDGDVDQTGRVGLGRQRTERAAERVATVVRRDNHADGWQRGVGHQRALFRTCLRERK